MNGWGTLVCSREAAYFRTLNKTASNVAKASFPDSIYSAVSVCRVLKDEQKVRLQDVSARTTAAVIARFGALGRLAECQLQRYAQIALKLAICKEFHATFFEIQDQLTQKGKTLGVFHIADSILLAFRDNAFCVALEALNRRLLELWQPNTETFETLRKDFYGGVASF